METKAARPPVFARSGTQRVIAGVAGGIAERLGVDPMIVRLAFVGLAFAGGFGVVLYLLAWLIGSEPGPASAATDTDRLGTTDTRKIVAVALVVTGMLLLLREAGLWLGDAVVWSIWFSALGSAFLWTRADRSDGGRFAKLAARLPRTPGEVMSERSRGRLVAGALLIVSGMAVFLAANTSLEAIGNVAFAVAVTTVGVGLILGPWIYELFRQLSSERRERIRSEERAEVAAHLHDSVLQTLALIQRAPSAKEMATLARAQERELRSWLFGRRSRTAPGAVDTMSAAIDELAARVEGMHRVPVETVFVGDVTLDDRLRAMVDATGEATTNAAKHSGAGVVSVYVEVGADDVNVYVRDEGLGFVSSTMPPDRKGITESIIARMERNGGTATVTSRPGEGTEVHLVMPKGNP